MYPPVLPWGSCGNYWNSRSCSSPYSRKELDCWMEVVNDTTNASYCMVGKNAIAEKELTDPVREFWE